MKKNVLNIILGCFIGLLIGCIITVVIVMQNNSKITKIKSEIALKDNNIKLKNQEIQEKDNKIQELEQPKKQEELNLKIEELDSKILTLTQQKESLENQIESLKESIIKIKGEERTYPAGYLTAGKDFEVGRYKIYGGKSNFSVHSLSGKLKVNIILGNNSEYHQVSEYLYTFSSGDVVEANSTFKMIPIE